MYQEVAVAMTVCLVKLNRQYFVLVHLVHVSGVCYYIWQQFPI